VKLVDTNVLLAVVNRSAATHPVSNRWLDRALGGDEPVGFAWLALVGFVRLSTSARVVPSPLSPGQAMDVVGAWLGARTSRVLHPGIRHAEHLRELLAAAGTAGNLTNDAHLAALALEHRATIVTFDSDYSRFAGVKWERPR